MHELFRVDYLPYMRKNRGIIICNPFISVDLSEHEIQSALVISTSVISNNRLSRRENLVLVLTQKSKIGLQNIVERGEIAPGEQFLPFSTIFSIYISN